MNRSLCLLCVIFIFVNFLSAQEHRSEEGRGMAPGLRRRAVVLDIDARVLESEQGVVWNECHQKLTIPGNPVGIQLVGANVVVAVQFTPFIRRSGNVLVAQGQIWINDPNNGVSYHTSIQTIPMEFNEPILFFPLGQAAELNQSSSIEIVLTVNPYRETEPPETAIYTDNDP